MSFQRSLEELVESGQQYSEAIPYERIEYITRAEVTDLRGKLEPFISSLPLMDQDIYHMVFNLGKNQGEMAQILIMTQAAVSYRLKRLQMRLKFFLARPELDREQMKVDLDDIVTALLRKHPAAGLYRRETVLDVAWHMYATTCQSETARLIKRGLSQSNIRNIFYDIINELEKYSELNKYYVAFKMVQDNPQALWSYNGRSHGQVRGRKPARGLERTFRWNTPDVLYSLNK